MTKQNKLLTISLLAVLLFVAILPFSAVFAEETSNILDDLKLDTTFDVNDYPAMSLDEVKLNEQPLMEIIQIAESEGNNLYIYVYQPTNNTLPLKATAISMSCEYSSNGQDLDPSPYELTLVSTSGVFNQYLVKDYQVTDEIYRYYNIIAIYREFNSAIDEEISGTDEIEKAISVGQQWCAYYLNDEIVYEMGTFETLEIEVKFTGSFDFYSGITIGNLMGSFKTGTSWFVSFNVEDYIVEHIYDAKLSYSIRTMSRVIGVGASGEWNYGDFEHKEVRLKDTDTSSYYGGGLLAKRYSWNRISSAQDFLANAEKQGITVSEECKSKLQESQWVFAFTETLKDEYFSYGTTTEFKSDIDAITILTLHFVDINHKIYNLGVVGDRVNPDNESDGYGGAESLTNFLRSELIRLYSLILLAIAAAFIVPLVIGALKFIFNIR